MVSPIFFLFTPKNWGRWSNLTDFCIFFRWVGGSTTKYVRYIQKSPGGWCTTSRFRSTTPFCNVCKLDRQRNATTRCDLVGWLPHIDAFRQATKKTPLWCEGLNLNRAIKSNNLSQSLGWKGRFHTNHLGPCYSVFHGERWNFLEENRENFTNS